jgi:hypothetical protein
MVAAPQKYPEGASIHFAMLQNPAQFNQTLLQFLLTET